MSKHTLETSDFVFERPAINMHPIHVVGIGGCGCNIVQNLANNPVKGVQYSIIDKTKRPEKNNILHQLVVEDETQTYLLNKIDDTECAIFIMVVGAAGKYNTPIVTELTSMVKNQVDEQPPTPVIVYTITPFDFENKKNLAISNIETIREAGATIITFDNNELRKYDVTIDKGFKIVDDWINSDLSFFSSFYDKESICYVDSNDIKTLLFNADKALTVHKQATGERRVIDATTALVDEISNHIQSARITGLLLSFVTSQEEALTMAELYDSTELLRDYLSSSCSILWGCSYGDIKGVEISAIATY